jgi:hypothetical protein
MSIPVQVVVTKYKAYDGEVFDEKADADFHETLLPELGMPCPLCSGDKFVQNKKCVMICPRCAGNGWVHNKDWNNERRERTAETASS